MSQKEAIQLFGDRKIRTSWSEEEERWYFSIVDVVSVLVKLVPLTGQFSNLLMEKIERIWEMHECLPNPKRFAQ